MMMKIVFHGANAETFLPGFAQLLDDKHEVILVSDTLDDTGEAEALASADVVVGISYHADLPRLSAQLYHLPSAGYDAVDMDYLPQDCQVCNCFGHEAAIAEYVMAALLARHVPLVQADSQLRQGDWHYWAGKPTGLRTELGAQSIGIVGHGHIGSTVAARARAFGMEVHVANRSIVQGDYAATYGLDQLGEMAGRVDILINTLPLADSTEGLIDADVLGAMRPDGIVMNVGRGQVIDEDALFAVLSSNKIGGAILDTWYVYPSADEPNPMPSRHPFHRLDNVTITPHMSGWTTGTIARRRVTLADNVNRLASGQPLANTLR